jgi:hypothetical protein
MNKESLVCTVKQSQKLKELGIRQQSYFYHFPNPNLEVIKHKYSLPDYNIVDGEKLLPEQREDIRTLVLNGTFQKTYAAFTVSEMAAMLQRSSNNIYFHKLTKLWSHKITPAVYATQAECFGNYLIHFLEAGSLTLLEANKRLLYFHQPKVKLDFTITVQHETFLHPSNKH